MNILLDESFSLQSHNLYMDPRKISLDQLSLDFNGAFDLLYENDVFNGYLHSADSEILCVILSAAWDQRVKNDGKVVFNFPGLIGKLNANMLYIEDPMYKKNKGLECGWFYGDEATSHVDQVKKIIEYVAEKNKIQRKNIVFIGASAGGYAALSCADRLKGSKAYVFNPQINLSDWPYAKQFSLMTGIDLESQDNLGRNDITYFLNNKESKFFINFNTFSALDEKPMKRVCNALDIEVKDGLWLRENIFVSLKSMNVNIPHNSRFDAEDVAVAICLMEGYENNLHEIYKAYQNKIYKIARFQDEIEMYAKFFDFLIKEMPSELGQAKKINSNYVDYSVNDDWGIFFYRLLYNMECKKFQFLFYINKIHHSFDEKYIDLISEHAQKHDDEFLINHDRGFMRICATHHTREDMHQAFVAFFERTYAHAKRQLEALSAAPAQAQALAQ